MYVVTAVRNVDEKFHLYSFFLPTQIRSVMCHKPAGVEGRPLDRLFYKLDLHLPRIHFLNEIYFL